MRGLFVRAFAAALALAACAPAWGQYETFVLSEGGWERVETPEPGTDEALIAECRRLLADDEAGLARLKLRTWIADHEFDRHPLLPEALLLLGDSRVARGNEYLALYDYERVIKEFPESPLYPTAVERELEIAVRYTNGRRRKFFGWRLVDAGSLGEQLLVRCAERMPGSALAERAIMELGEYYYRERDMVQAAEAYTILQENFPKTRYRKRAMQRRVYANIARFKGPAYDASGLVEARALIEDFARRYPAEASEAGMDRALTARLDESTAAQKLEVARWYLRRGDETSARFMLDKVLHRFPTTVAASRATELLVEHGWLDLPDAHPGQTPRDEHAALEGDGA